jgi:hypothetical protein
VSFSISRTVCIPANSKLKLSSFIERTTWFKEPLEEDFKTSLPELNIFHSNFEHFLTSAFTPRQPPLAAKPAASWQLSSPSGQPFKVPAIVGKASSLS